MREEFEISQSFGLVPRAVWILIGCLMVGFVGVTDYITGWELSFSIFYLVPVTVVTLAGGLVYGAVISAVAAFVWLAADILSGHSYSHPIIPYWNGVVRLGFFVLHAYLLSNLTAIVRREKKNALTDPLTGAANWRLFRRVAEREMEAARRGKKPITLAYVDVDNFKTINDTLGHDAGDSVLRKAVESILAHTRPSDTLGRLGGDEFALLLPDGRFEDIGPVLRRIRDGLSAEMKQNGWQVTFSIGAVTFNAVPVSAEAMVKSADALMYSVKQTGKDNLAHSTWPES
jgi:diguanylate cyclase (GGDEF)-like protein